MRLAEYIKREAVLDICEETYQERLRMMDYCGDTVAFNIGHAIKSLPIADVAPVRHGRWERSENESNDEAFSFTDEEAWYYWKCSVCHEDICYHDAPMGRSFLPKYCPNCGARCDL